MPVTVEVLRSLNQWVRINDLGPEPYEIRSDRYTRIRYIIGQDEDGTGAVLTTISPAKDGLGKKLSEAIRQPVFEIETKPLQPGHAVTIEGILPGNTKSEILRINQE